VWGEPFVGVQVVIGGLREWGRLRFADVCPDRDRRVHASESLGDGVRARVVEPHPVDDRFVFGESEQSRTRVASLSFGGDGPDLDVTEPEGAQHLRDPGVLVETRGDPDGIGEVGPENGRFEGGIGDR
jgi:hypothetical protein